MCATRTNIPKHKGHKQKEQKTNNGPHQKTKVRATVIPLKLELDRKVHDGK